MLTPSQIKRAAQLYEAIASAEIELKKLRDATRISLVAQNDRSDQLGTFHRTRGASALTLNRWDDIEAAELHRFLLKVKLKSRDAMVRELAQLGAAAPEISR
ncbi:hypothetical protein ACIPUD_11205 [Bradyrhizobium sp. CAR08]